MNYNTNQRQLTVDTADTCVCQPCQGNTRLYVRGDPSGEAYLNYGLCQTTWVYPVYDYQLQTTVANTKPSTISVRAHGQSCYTSRLVQVSTRGHEVPCIERAHRVSLQRLKQVLFLQCLARVRLKWPCASNLYQVWFPPEWAQFRQTSFHDNTVVYPYKYLPNCAVSQLCCGCQYTRTCSYRKPPRMHCKSKLYICWLLRLQWGRFRMRRVGRLSCTMKTTRWETLYATLSWRSEYVRRMSMLCCTRPN